MKAKEVRAFHRVWGLGLVAFLTFQAGTGFLLSLRDLIPSQVLGPVMNLAGYCHYGWNPWGAIFRLLLAGAILAQGISGLIIYVHLRARQKPPPPSPHP